MKSRTWLNLKAQAETFNLSIERYSPGDGYSRYQFYRKREGMSEFRIGPCHKGLIEAFAFLNGYSSAVHYHYDMPSLSK